MSAYTLHLGDCLDILPTLAPQSVDAILTDLPYGTTACAWDEVIPFAPMWEQVKRVLKPRGVFVTTASQPFTSKLVMSNLEWFKYEWIIEQEQGSNLFNAPFQPIKSHQNIVVFSGAAASFSPNSSMIYNPQMGNGKRYKSNIVSGEYKFHSKKRYPKDNEDGTRYPKSIIYFPRETGFHPTQKPVSLYTYLTLTYTNPGDTVLDICFGSCTTGVACMVTGRNFVGIERDPGYTQSVAAASPPPPLSRCCSHDWRNERLTVIRI